MSNAVLSPDESLRAAVPRVQAKVRVAAAAEAKAAKAATDVCRRKQNLGKAKMNNSVLDQTPKATVPLIQRPGMS